MMRQLFCKTEFWYGGVGTRHGDVVVVFVAMDADRDRVVGILEDSLDDVDAGLSMWIFR
jgi:hypothetical protein